MKINNIFKAGLTQSITGKCNTSNRKCTKKYKQRINERWQVLVVIES